MTQRIVTIVAVTMLLSGCVSDSDFATVSSQVQTLRSKVRTLESEVQALKSEDRQIVRLPTGSPTRTEARSMVAPAYTLSPQERDFEAALQTYKTGDTNAAISAFEQFNSRYPNAKQHKEALFYLGQASYTVRDYSRARQVLEELVYQTPGANTNPKAVSLLQQVYRAQGDAAGLQQLQQFMDNLNAPTPVSNFELDLF